MSTPLRGAAAASVVLAVLAATGCSGEGNGCSRGSDAPETAVRTFLDSALADDVEGMRSLVLPGMTVSDEGLETVRASVADHEVEDLFISASQEAAGWHQLRVNTQAGELVGEWEVGELEGSEQGCYAVYWGEVDPNTATSAPTPAAEET